MNLVDKNCLLGNRNQKAIPTCEAIDCYENSTETIIVSAGKIGTINLNLCRRCAVTKFQTIPPQDTILKKNGCTGQKTPLNQPVEDYCE